MVCLISAEDLKDVPQAYLYKMFPVHLVLPQKSGYVALHLFSVVQSHYGW